MVNCNELSTHYEHIHVILYYELTLASKKVAKSRRIYLRTPVQISLGDRKRTPVAICPELLVVVSSSLIFILLLAVSAVVMAAARYILTPVMLTSFIRTNFAVASDFTRVLPLFHRQLWHFDGIGHDVYLCSLAPSYCFFFSRAAFHRWIRWLCQPCLHCSAALILQLSQGKSPSVKTQNKYVCIQISYGDLLSMKMRHRFSSIPVRHHVRKERPR